MITVTAAVDAFLADLALAGRSPKTCRTYNALLRSLRSASPLDTLTPDACRALLMAKTQTMRASSVKTTGAAIRSFTTYCLQRGWIAADPMLGIPLPKPKAPPHRYLSRDEVQRVWQSCNTDYQRLIVCLLMGGLRASEATGLRMRDIDIERGVITVTGKGSKVRTVPLDARTAALLPVGRAGTDKVITPSYGSLRTIVQRLGARAGVGRLHAHLFRHTWASHALAAGVDAWVVQETGGWSNDEMLARYTRSIRSDTALERMRTVAMTERLLGSQ